VFVFCTGYYVQVREISGEFDGGKPAVFSSGYITFAAQIGCRAAGITYIEIYMYINMKVSYFQFARRRCGICIHTHIAVYSVCL
jgi:hypothetical protein